MEKTDWLKAILSFDKMLAPLILKGIYFLGVIGVVLSGIIAMFTSGFIHGLVVMLFGPVFVRLWCEMMIVMFGIHENLVALRKLKTHEMRDARGHE